MINIDYGPCNFCGVTIDKDSMDHECEKSDAGAEVEVKELAIIEPKPKNYAGEVKLKRRTPEEREQYYFNRLMKAEADLATCVSAMSFIPQVIEQLENEPTINDITQFTNEFYELNSVLAKVGNRE